MRYQIEGADQETGKPAQVEMDADTPESARRWATEHGILVSSVRPLDIPPRLPVQTIPYATPAPSRGVRTGLAMAYVGAAGLFVAVVGLATWLFWRDSRGTPLAPTPRAMVPGRVARTAPPSISGRILFHDGRPMFVLGVVCLGQWPDGRVESSDALLSGDWACSNSGAQPRMTDLSFDQATGTMSHEHGQRLPGWYLLLLLRGEEKTLSAGGYQVHYEDLYDWKWVKLTSPTSQITTDLVIDPAALGEVAVSAPGAPVDADVSCLPMRPDGQPPWRDAHVAAGVGHAKVTEGRAVIRLREGRYQLGLLAPFSLGRALLSTTEVRVVRGTTSHATLAPQPQSTPHSRSADTRPSRD